MFQMIRPGSALRPWTSLCGPTVTPAEPMSQPVYPKSSQPGSPNSLR
jgi:hypothetical protein